MTKGASMTSDAKIGLSLGLVFIFVIAFTINSLTNLSSRSSSKEYQQSIIQLRSRLGSIINKAKDPNDKKAISELTPEIQEKIAEYILLQALESSKNKSEIQKIVEIRLNEINERIKKVKEELPDETGLSKSILLSNALLATRIEQLSEQVKRIQAQILTKWDVALIFCAIIAGITAIAGATSTVLRLIYHHKRRYY